MRTFLLLSLLTLFTFACGGSDTDNTAETETMEAEAPAEIAIAPMPASPDFPGAMITGMRYNGTSFDFAIDGGADDYQLGAQTPDAEQKMCANSAKGQHIHLIVNNEPYAAKYTADFEYEIPDGKQYVLAFLSRSYHESIKHAGAAKAVKMTVTEGGFTSQEDVTEPMLFYSRPKGTYVGKDTEKVMLDFYLANVDLGTDYQVKAEVGGQTFMIDKWQPYYLTGLPMGENTVKLTLVDGDGNPVNAPLNPVSRTFTLAEDKAEG